MIKLPDEILEALSTLEENNYEAYVVGGAVRNALLKTKINDYDITTNATPNVVKILFNKYNQYTIGEKHGTVVVLIGSYKIDITTYRQDIEYIDHRHPKSVSFSSNLKDDLIRRDFTINAMCLDKRGNIIDLFNGIKDLENKVIRAIGDPDARFREDALRILRAIKFAGRYNFTIEEETEKAIFKNRNLLNYIANERKKEELLAILSTNKKAAVINTYLDVFNTFMDFKAIDEEIDNFKDPYFALAYLLSKSSDSNLKQLKYSKNEINLLNALNEATSCDIDLDREFIRVLSNIYKTEILTYLSQLHNIDLKKRYELLKPYIITINELDISGADLTSLGFKGKEISEIKKKLLLKIHDKELNNKKDELIEYLKNQ